MLSNMIDEEQIQFPLFFLCSSMTIWKNRNKKVDDFYGWDDGEGNQTYSQPIIDKYKNIYFLVASQEIADIAGIDTTICITYDKIEFEIHGT